jgi:hypothetical protein
VAKRAALIRVKPKKTKVTRSEAYLVNVKYMGAEPEAKELKSRTDIMNALSWYNTMCTKDDAREYMITFLNKLGERDRAKKIKLIPDAWVPLHAAWQCRISDRIGARLPQESYSKVLTAIDYAISKGVEPAEDKPKVDKPSIMDRTRERAHDIIGEVEALVDAGDFDLYEWLKKNEIPAMYAIKIGNYYGPIWNEFVQAHAGKIDGYEKWTKAQLKARMDYYNKIVSDAERYGDVTKKTRAVRKPRAVSIDKVLKNFRYQKESAEYKVASVTPDKVIGAQELWTFNAKYGYFTVFRALDRGGLKVNRSSIAGFDEANSKCYRTGRQTAKLVDQMAKASKASAKKIAADLKEGTFNARINENTILLRIF